MFIGVSQVKQKSIGNRNLISSVRDVSNTNFLSVDGLKVEDVCVLHAKIYTWLARK